jgi:hypothetical protein
MSRYLDTTDLDNVRAEYDKKILAMKEKSVFDLPIKNTLGLDNMRRKAELKAFALQHPVEYTKARAEAFEDIVSQMVEDSYRIIWNLLKKGEIGNSGITLFSKTKGLELWSPQLQDAEISKLATGYSESVLNLFDELFEKIVPSDYKQLAEDKLTTLAKLDIVGRS